MNPPSDNDLARQWQQGDVSAYNELVARHLDPLHRYAMARLGSRSAADDVCQEVFLELCRRIGAYDPSRPFAAWFHTVTRHKIADYCRKNRSGVEFDPEQHAPVDEAHPAYLAEERDSARQIWRRVFRLLSTPRATALWLRVQRQMSVREIAAAMARSEADVKVLLFRARQQLAAEWHDSQPD